MTDPDLTVRLVATPSESLAPWLDFLKTLSATLAGALVAFWLARRTDRTRAEEERRSLAAAAAAELQASRSALAGAMEAATEWDPDHNRDTIMYGSLPVDPTPLVRAAYEKAGAFPQEVAVELAQFMTLQRQFRQQVEILQAMRAQSVLTGDKEKGHQAAMHAIAVRLSQSLLSLSARLDEYADRRSWWKKGKRN